MTLLCPLCEHPMDSEPQASVLAEIPMQPQLRAITKMLASAYPRSVSHDRIFDDLYGDDPSGGPDNPRAVVAVRISKLRKILPEYGWTVRSARVGMGSHRRYQLAPAETEGA